MGMDALRASILRVRLDGTEALQVARLMVSEQQPVGFKDVQRASFRQNDA
jgi:hypothetical protein